MDRKSNSRARIEEIKKRSAKREREFRRKRMMIRRVILLVILAVIVLLISMGVKSCISSMAERRAQKKAEAEQAAQAAVTQSPESGSLSGVSGSTPIDRLSKSDIDQNFFADSAFFGNSFIDGMEIYELVDNAEYIGEIGLSVSDALEGDSNGDVLVDRLADGDYKKIFMMFGENELGWSSRETFEDKYAALIKKVKEYQPSAQIYLLSVTPISKEVSDTAEDGTTRENIIAFNKMIRSVAQNANVNFADIFNGLAVNGYLPDGAADDGVHFGENYYIKCLVDIQEAFGRSSSANRSSSGNSSGNSTGTSGSSGNASDDSTGTSNSSGSNSDNSGSSSSSGSDESGESDSSSGNDSDESDESNSSSGSDSDESDESDRTGNSSGSSSDKSDDSGESGGSSRSGSGNSSKTNTERNGDTGDNENI